MEIKPIETIYNGYRFRSRLEARWAVFFDRYGIDYIYEPQGFKLSNGDYYLPDFYLIKLDTYVEIKARGAFDLNVVSDKVVFQEGQDKYAYAAFDIANAGHIFFLAFGDPYDVMPVGILNRSNGHLFYKGKCFNRALSEFQGNLDSLYCVKNGKEYKCSNCKNYELLCHSYVAFLSKGKSNQPEWLTFDEIDYKENDCGFKEPAPRTIRDNVFPLELYLTTLQTYKECEGDTLQTFKDEFRELASKAQFARQTRFEHGETPTT